MIFSITWQNSQDIAHNHFLLIFTSDKIVPSLVGDWRCISVNDCEMVCDKLPENVTAL